MRRGSLSLRKAKMFFDIPPVFFRPWINWAYNRELFSASMSICVLCLSIFWLNFVSAIGYERGVGGGGREARRVAAWSKVAIWKLKLCRMMSGRFVQWKTSSTQSRPHHLCSSSTCTVYNSGHAIWLNRKTKNRKIMATSLSRNRRCCYSIIVMVFPNISVKFMVHIVLNP